MSVQRWSSDACGYHIPDDHGTCVGYGDHLEALLAEGGAAREYGYISARAEVREKILTYYKVAPKAANPLLRILGMETI